MYRSCLSIFALLSLLLVCNAQAGGLSLKKCKQLCSKRPICGTPTRSSRKAKTSSVRTGQVKAGGSCTSDADCSAGYGCAASKTCNQIVEDVTYSVFANDESEIFINGQYQGFVPSGFYVKQFTYSGVCDDIIMKVVNGKKYIASAILMEYGGWNHGSQGFHQTPNGIALPIYGRAKLSPEGNFTNNDPSYDYMSWNEAILSTGTINENNFPPSMKDAGADPVTSDDIVTPDGSVMGIRFEFPDCN